MTKIIAVANQKGGVGKTTTTVNLATGVAATQKTVLLIDLDPQGNASTGVGCFYRSPGTYELIMGNEPLSSIERKTYIPGLHVVPTTSDLAAAEVELVSYRNREYQLKEALSVSSFDFIFIDCPPSLGLLTLNALIAAHSVIIPLQCEYYALEGLSHLLKTIEAVKRYHNPKLFLQGIVLTMYDQRNALNRSVVEDVQKNMGNIVYTSIIPRNVKVSESPSHGKPVLIYDVKSSGSKAYIKLAGEFLKQENQ